MNQSALESLLADVAGGRVDVGSALVQLQSATTHSAPTADATVDIDRARRGGFPESASAQGTPPQAIVEIFERQRDCGQRCFATRVSEEQAAAVRRRFPDVAENPVAKTVRIGSPPDVQGTVVVVTAGTSDRPVAEEALETLRWMG